MASILHQMLTLFSNQMYIVYIRCTIFIYLLHLFSQGMSQHWGPAFA